MADNRNRMFYIKTLLEQKSDPEHTLTTDDFKTALPAAGYKFVYNTFNEDIRALQENGMDLREFTDILGKKHYYLATRAMAFEAAEFTVSTIAANPGFDSSLKEALAGSILSLFSDYQADRLRDTMRTIDAGCFGNLQTGYLSTLSTAIQQKLTCTFFYRRYLPGDRWEYRKEPDPKDPSKQRNKKYVLSPYSLHITNGAYYVRGYCDNGGGGMRNFRLDRMDQLTLPEKAVEAVPCPEEYNPAEYSREAVYMYDGPRVLVTLDCDHDTMDALRDRFGDKVTTLYGKNGTFRCSRYIRISPAFFGWLCMLRGRIRLVGPPEAKQAFQDFLEDCRKI